MSTVERALIANMEKLQPKFVPITDGVIHLKLKDFFVTSRPGNWCEVHDRATNKRLFTCNHAGEAFALIQIIREHRANRQGRQ